MHANVPFAWAYIPVTNETQDPMVRNEAHLEDPSEGFETRSTWVAPPGHAPELHVDSPFFRQRPFMHPLAGFTVEPGSSYFLVFVLEVPANGAYAAKAVSLSYAVGQASYVISFPDSIRVCAPYSRTIPCSTAGSASADT